MSAWTAEVSAGSDRWLSREFSELITEATAATAPGFDVLIVGSGYGGAIAAAGFAGCRENGRNLRVGVLERGREYLPGAFPSRMADLPKHVRGSAGSTVRGGEALFDVRAGTDVTVLVANGLGGGSLINAGVMEIPKPAVFGEAWPAALRDTAERSRHYQRAKQLLGAADANGDNRIGTHARLPQGGLGKTQVLKRLAGGNGFREAAITVAMADKETVGGVKLDACQLCGDCATGCNHNAKESLDTNLLAKAARQGAEIYCGATVLRIQRAPGSAWRVLVTHTDERRRRCEGQAFWITTRKLILSAGALGSSEILLKSQRHSSSLHFSPRLGKRFSTNGDMLCFGYGYETAAAANAIADEETVPAQRAIGPTITGIIDARLRHGEREQDVVIEEMAVPGALRRWTEEMLTSADVLRNLEILDGARHDDGRPANDPAAVHPHKLKRSSVLAVMGDDGAGGSLRLVDAQEIDDGDGYLRVDWPQARELPLFDAQIQQIQALAGAAEVGGRTIANPLWQLLPPKMAELLRAPRGPLLTVHPLGGCAMADSPDHGVVDACGRVYDAAPAEGDGHDPRATRVHEGLVVLDGAIVPTALSTNPALTIAMLALRAVGQLRAEWGWQEAEPRPAPAESRPVLAEGRGMTAQTLARHAQPARKTQAEFRERLSGPVRLRDNRQSPGDDYWLELTLVYRDLALEHLFRPDASGTLAQAQLEIDPGESRLRLFRRRDFAPGDWQRLVRGDLTEQERRQRFEPQAPSHPLSGTLILLEREASGPVWRTLRALFAWLLNRGLRDMAQGLAERLRHLGQRLIGRGTPRQGPGFLELVMGIVRLASRAGEVRRFRYELQVAAAEKNAATFASPLSGNHIQGLKRIRYGRPGNPWRQLTELTLTQFPALRADRRKPLVVSLDPRYLASQLTPLFRFSEHDNQVNALADAASLAAYLARTLLPIHFWNLRKPDTPRPRHLERLPGLLPGLPPPEVHELEVDRLDGEPVRIRLTRYRKPASTGAPVVMIHGYSASGTTFAHPALKSSLAQDLAEQGRDAWVLDLRSSCGMPTGSRPWTFERMALADIPAAIDYVYHHSGEQQVDVIAHCMGAAMFSMAVLSAELPAQAVFSAHDAGVEDRFRAERRALPARIRRVVLSQIGPVMVIRPENVFRAFLGSFAQWALAPSQYRFRPEAGQGAAWDVFDRLCSSLPYPDAELLQENTPAFWRNLEHLGTRHRMDALYGRTFRLDKLPPETLKRLDDFFGPISLSTLAQVIHLARHQTITNRSGRNPFVSAANLRRLWRFPTMSIHGEDNGLADIATLERMRQLLPGLRIHAVPGHGHQDCLIGRDARSAVFGPIRDFLDEQDPQTRASHSQNSELDFEPPMLGPMLTVSPATPDVWRLGLGSDPARGAPLWMCMLPLGRHDGCWDLDWHALSQITPKHDAVAWSLPEDGDDWHSCRLPDWIAHTGARHVAVLLAYAPLGAPASTVFAQRASGLRATPPSSPGELIALHKPALRQALQALNDEAQHGDGVPQGVLVVPPPRTANGTTLQIALGSCQYPPGPLDRELAYASWKRLNRRLEQEQANAASTTQLLLLTGDQVYVDATGGLLDPILRDDRYRNPYVGWLGNDHVRSVLRRLPAATMLDDHEIRNDWEPVAPPGNGADRLASKGHVPLAPRRLDTATHDHESDRHAGIRSFLRYQRAEQPLQNADDPLSFSFDFHGAAIYMLDTRTQRGRRSAASDEPATLLNARQLAALKSWLSDPAKAALPKLIVTPALLLPRHRRAAPARLAFGQRDRDGLAHLRSDSWDGYPDSFYELLAHIADRQIRNVIFLGGDEHLGLHATATVRRAGSTDSGVTIHVMHTPGLYAPLPFANSRREDFMPDETFRFQSEVGTYDCTVRSKLAEGGGFALLTLGSTAGGERGGVSYEIV